MTNQSSEALETVLRGVTYEQIKMGKFLIFAFTRNMFNVDFKGVCPLKRFPDYIFEAIDEEPFL